MKLKQFQSLSLIMSAPMTLTAKERIVFSGAPAGGTFQVVANAMQTCKPLNAS